MMIAYCGLDCEKCEAFIATRNNDDAMRARVAADWAKRFNPAIRPEHINCTGCKAPGPKTYFCDNLCEIRKCASGRHVDTCADCNEYPCAVLNQFLTVAADAKVRLETLRKERAAPRKS